MNQQENPESERQLFLEEIFDSAVDAIVVIDERGLVVDANPAVTKLFGMEVDEILGRNVSVLMPSPYREQHDGYLHNYRHSGERKIIGVGREVVGQRKDGTTFPMHLAVSEIHSNERRLFVGVVRDITDLKEAETRLQQLNDDLEDRVQQRTDQIQEMQAELVRSEKLATLGQVSGGIAHEIRNPLNVVKTSIYYLCHAKSPSQDKVNEHLSRIDRQVTMIDNVVTALTDAARLPEPNPSQVNVRVLVDEVTRSVELGKDVRVQNDCREDLPDAKADANQIPIVLRNLIRNARDAMPEGGLILVSATADEQRIKISVQDEGVGIPQEMLSKILEPLYTTKARGMGLGLAISIAILQKNGGSLDVRSTVGRGTTFDVILPRSNGSA